MKEHFHKGYEEKHTLFRIFAFSLCVKQEADTINEEDYSSLVFDSNFVKMNLQTCACIQYYTEKRAGCVDPALD